MSCLSGKDTLPIKIQRPRFKGERSSRGVGRQALQLPVQPMCAKSTRATENENEGGEPITNVDALAYRGRSMERSLHVEARGWTIVFGTYLDVIVRRYRRWRAGTMNDAGAHWRARYVDRELLTRSRNEEDPDGQL